jgi:hypothetical protein
VQHFRLDEPGIVKAKQAARLGYGPSEGVNLNAWKRCRPNARARSPQNTQSEP